MAQAVTAALPVCEPTVEMPIGQEVQVAAPAIA